MNQRSECALTPAVLERVGQPHIYRLQRKDDPYDAQFFFAHEWELIVIPVAAAAVQEGRE